MNSWYMNIALADVQREREQQDQKWGEQHHAPAVWLAILVEEVGEVAKVVAETTAGDDTMAQRWPAYREELVQVAAVAVAAIEALDAGALS